MAKSSSRRSAKNGTKTSAKRNSPSNNTGRPRPMAPKAGLTKNRTRYEEGGNWCW